MSTKEYQNDTRLQLLSGLGNGLWEMRRSGVCCDITVIAGGVQFPCHKAVLCAVSSYFTAMFTHDMKESRESIVTLHEIKADLFENILECIYTGVDIVTEDTVDEIMEVASLMQLETILARCVSHFIERLSISNFIDVWYTSKKYSCQRLEEKVWSFILINFSVLCENDDLSLLPFESMVALLKSDHLNVKNEDCVCRAAIKWLLSDFENRKTNANALLATLRFPLCSSEYIITDLSQEDITSMPGMHEAIQEALVYHMCPAKKHMFSSTSMCHRATSRHADVLVVMGGTDIPDYTGSGMRCYSFLGQQWYTLPSLPVHVGPHYATCTFGDDIFVSGGQYNREGIHKFQASVCMWFSLSKMPIGRYKHAMVAVSDVIYTLGGEGADSKTIHEYNVSALSWEECGELLDTVPHAAATVYNQMILIFGISTKSEFIQLYDTVYKQVTIVENFAVPGLGSRAVTCGSVTYVVSTDGHVTVMSDKKSSHVGTIQNFHENKFGMTQFKGNIYIVSGTKVSSEKPIDTSKVRVICPNTLNVIDTIQIPLTPGGLPWLCNGTRLTCCRVVLSKHHLKDNIIHEQKAETQRMQKDTNSSSF